MKKSQLKKLIRELINEQLLTEQTPAPAACWDPCATNFNSPLGDWDGPVPYLGTGDYLPSLTATSDCGGGNASSVSGYNSVVFILHQIGTYEGGAQSLDFCQDGNQMYDAIFTSQVLADPNFSTTDGTMVANIDTSCCQYPSSGPQDPGKAVPNKDINLHQPDKPGTSQIRKPKPPTSPVGGPSQACKDQVACNFGSNFECYYCFNNDCKNYPSDDYDCDGNMIF